MHLQVYWLYYLIEGQDVEVDEEDEVHHLESYVNCYHQVSNTVDFLKIYKISYRIILSAIHNF